MWLSSSISILIILIVITILITPHRHRLTVIAIPSSQQHRHDTTTTTSSSPHHLLHTVIITTPSSQHHHHTTVTTTSPPHHHHHYHTIIATPLVIHTSHYAHLSPSPKSRRSAMAQGQLWPAGHPSDGRQLHRRRRCARCEVLRVAQRFACPTRKRTGKGLLGRWLLWRHSGGRLRTVCRPVSTTGRGGGEGRMRAKGGWIRGRGKWKHWQQWWQWWQW